MRATFAIFLIAQLAAQQTSTPENPPGFQKGTAATFQVTTNLVVVNVTAKDKNGNPLEGLKASDFTVTEDGKPQQIGVFEYQRLEDATLPAPTPSAPEASPASVPTTPAPK